MSGVLDALDAAFPDDAQADIMPTRGGSATANATTEGSGQGDENTKRYLLEVVDTPSSLLSLAREDTGEQGTERDGYTAFESCPVCGHSDCFRVYADRGEGETWACYGGSNPNANASGCEVGGLLEYLKRARHYDNREAVRFLLDATGHQHADGKASREQVAQEPPEAPPWRHVNAIDPPKPPPDLIHGVLRRGEAGLLVSKAKAGKSYTAIEAAVAVSCGLDWLGYRCERGRVLYIDPELSQVEFDNRCKRVAEAMGADPLEVSERTQSWQLDGVLIKDEPPTIEYVAATIAKFAGEESFDLIVIDSASFLVRGDENASVDVRRFWAYVGRIRRATGAAVLVIHHEGHARSGDRDAIARARGSSAWGDCPGSPLALTEIFPSAGEPSDYLEEGERAFVLEDSGMRSHAGVGGRHVIWHWPTHVLDTTGLTEGWKPKSSQGDGGKQTANLNKVKRELRATQCVSILLSHMLANGIGKDGMAAGDAAQVVSEAIEANVKTTTLKAYVAASDLLDVWQKGNRWRVVARHLPREQGQAGMPI